MTLNQQWRLARQPIEGWPTDGDFALGSADIAEPGANQALTRTLYLSLDPYQWGRRRSGIEQTGEVCHGRTVSQVLKSRLSGYHEGDVIFNTNGWQEYGLVGQDISEFGYMHPRVLDTSQALILLLIWRNFLRQNILGMQNIYVRHLMLIIIKYLPMMTSEVRYYPS